MTQTRSLLLLFFIPLLLLLATGCSTLPISGPLPESLTATRIASIDEAAQFAVSPDGTVVAYPDAGLKLLHLPTRENLTITAERAELLAWSPFGASLAAAFFKEGNSTVIIYDQHGIKVTETIISGRLTDLDWLSENELVAAALSIKNYKFGSNYQSILHRWQPGRAEPTTTPLRDSTLQPASMAKLGTLLQRGPKLAIYPTGSQILYLHPVDPPLFTPYYKLILRDLASGQELEIAQLGLNSDGGRFTRHGEVVIYGDGHATTTLYDPWSEETVSKAATAGKNLAISPSGSYWFADGALHRGEKLVARLAPGGVARFTPDSRNLLVAANGALYLLSGLLPADSQQPLASPEKLSQLRSWRIEGLVTPKEYRESIERMKTP